MRLAISQKLCSAVKMIVVSISYQNAFFWKSNISLTQEIIINLLNYNLDFNWFDFDCLCVLPEQLFALLFLPIFSDLKMKHGMSTGQAPLSSTEGR